MDLKKDGFFSSVNQRVFNFTPLNVGTCIPCLYWVYILDTDTVGPLHFLYLSLSSSPPTEPLWCLHRLHQSPDGPAEARDGAGPPKGSAGG